MNPSHRAAAWEASSALASLRTSTVTDEYIFRLPDTVSFGRCGSPSPSSTAAATGFNRPDRVRRLAEASDAKD
eukprot:scaffold264_cov317-Pinguiococcus_pyrenoidosus.AAC.21